MWSSEDVEATGSGVHRRHHCRWCGRKLDRRPPKWARDTEDLGELGIFTFSQYRLHLEEARPREAAERAWQRLAEAEEIQREAAWEQEREDSELLALDGSCVVFDAGAQLDLLELIDPKWKSRTVFDDLLDELFREF